MSGLCILAKENITCSQQFSVLQAGVSDHYSVIESILLKGNKHEMAQHSHNSKIFIDYDQFN